jgi:hypothetical protein
MPGLVPGIHVLILLSTQRRGWLGPSPAVAHRSTSYPEAPARVGGTSPAMTLVIVMRRSNYARTSGPGDLRYCFTIASALM